MKLFFCYVFLRSRFLSLCSLQLSFNCNQSFRYIHHRYTSEIRFVWYDSFLSFSFVSLFQIHTCSHLLTYDAHHYMHIQRARKIPRNNRLPLSSSSFSLFLSFDLCKIISASELCETRWQTRRLSTTQHTPHKHSPPVYVDSDCEYMCAHLHNVPHSKVYYNLNAV